MQLHIVENINSGLFFIKETCFGLSIPFISSMGFTTAKEAEFAKSLLNLMYDKMEDIKHDEFCFVLKSSLRIAKINSPLKKVFK